MMTTGRTGAELTPAPHATTSWYKSLPKRVASIVGGLVTAGGILIGIYPTALNFRDLRLFSGDLTGRW